MFSQLTQKNWRKAQLKMITKTFLMFTFSFLSTNSLDWPSALMKKISASYEGAPGSIPDVGMGSHIVFRKRLKTVSAIAIRTLDTTLSYWYEPGP